MTMKGSLGFIVNGGKPLDYLVRNSPVYLGQGQTQKDSGLSSFILDTMNKLPQFGDLSQ